MPPQEPDQQAADSGHYVELEELRPGGFVTWAISDAPSTRLRSVTGPPGGGKSTFLKQIETRLLPNTTCFLLPLLLLSGSEKVELTLQRWLNSISEVARIQGIPNLYASPGITDYRERWIAIVNKLSNACGPGRVRVLLVDGFDELTKAQRELIEKNVVEPFLLPAHGDSGNNRSIIARRYEHALTKATLRWEDDVHPLKGLALDQQSEQIKRRLAVIQSRPENEARAWLEWPEATDPNVSAAEQASITAAVNFSVQLDDTQTRELVDLLKDFLTPNPLVNLLELRRQFLHPGTPLDASDCRDCLERYVERSRVPTINVVELIGLVRRLVNPASFVLPDANNPLGNAQFEELKESGLMTQIPGTTRYCFEPAVIQLVSHI